MVETWKLSLNLHCIFGSHPWIPCQYLHIALTPVPTMHDGKIMEWISYLCVFLQGRNSKVMPAVNCLESVQQPKWDVMQFFLLLSYLSTNSDPVRVETCSFIVETKISWFFLNKIICIGLWHSENRASWYSLIIKDDEMHYFSNLFW
jgi:hypothetical protein